MNETEKEREAILIKLDELNEEIRMSDKHENIDDLLVRKADLQDALNDLDMAESRGGEE